MRKLKIGDPGSVSSGTMRAEDLIPIFVFELRRLDHEDGELRDIEERMLQPGYYESEDADYDLNEYLFDALNEHAPDHHYFGAHPSDGSDYGFWLCEEDE